MLGRCFNIHSGHLKSLSLRIYVLKITTSHSSTRIGWNFCQDFANRSSPLFPGVWRSFGVSGWLLKLRDKTTTLNLRSDPHLGQVLSSSQHRFDPCMITTSAQPRSSRHCHHERPAAVSGGAVQHLVSCVLFTDFHFKTLSCDCPFGQSHHVLHFCPSCTT